MRPLHKAGEYLRQRVDQVGAEEASMRPLHKAGEYAEAPPVHAAVYIRFNEAPAQGRGIPRRRIRPHVQVLVRFNEAPAQGRGIRSPRRAR